MELGGRTLFQNVSLNLAARERLGIVGRNGLGKSTLLKIMLRQMEPTSGEVEIGARTEINYVDQNRLLLDDAKTVWEEVGEGSEYVRLGEENITLRGYLRRFPFHRGTHQHEDQSAQRRRAEPGLARENS